MKQLRGVHRQFSSMGWRVNEGFGPVKARNSPVNWLGWATLATSAGGFGLALQTYNTNEKARRLEVARATLLQWANDHNQLSSPLSHDASQAFRDCIEVMKKDKSRLDGIPYSSDPLSLEKGELVATPAFREDGGTLKKASVIFFNEDIIFALCSRRLRENNPMYELFGQIDRRPPQYDHIEKAFKVVDETFSDMKHRYDVLKSTTEQLLSQEEWIKNDKRLMELLERKVHFPMQVQRLAKMIAGFGPERRTKRSKDLVFDAKQIMAYAFLGDDARKLVNIIADSTNLSCQLSKAHTDAVSNAYKKSVIDGKRLVATNGWF